MEIIDNINQLFGDSLKRTVGTGAKLKIAASCFSIYAYEALKTELAKIKALEFIFTSPTFVPSQVADRVKKREAGSFLSRNCSAKAAYTGLNLKSGLKID